jgi:KDO2-lipid IV(A) lauroyltransferase
MNQATTPEPLSLSRKDRLYLGLLRFFSRRSLGFLQRLGAFVGWLASHMPGNSAYKVVKRNLELCFPEQSPEWVEKATRANLMDTAPVAFEFAKTWGMPPEYSISQIKQVHGEEVFFEAINSGKGTIALIPHFGTWEFMNAWTGQHTPPTIMYKPGKDKGVDTFVLEARSRLNSVLVPADERGVKGLLLALKKNGFIAVLPDHVPQDNGGIHAPFFGISTWTGVIVPRLIQRTKCSVILMSCIRRPNADGFDIFFERPDPEIFSDDLLTSTTAMNRSIETMIRRNPTQYHWFYKRFRKNETLPDPYYRR